MKKVLIITYYWPPAGGPGVQRVLKFVKYLPQFGWQPIILTVKDGEYPAYDESLLNEIPAECKVYKTKAMEPFNLYKKFLGKGKSQAIPKYIMNKSGNETSKDKFAVWIRSNLFIPDARIGWVPYLVKEGLKIIKEEKPQVIFSTSPPHSLQLGAKKLARKSGLKWIADFRDPWSEAYWLANTPRTWLTKLINIGYEKSVLRNANKVSSINSELVSLYQSKCDNDYFILQNGYEEIENNFEDSDKFILMHLGNVTKSQNPETLFRALDMMAEEIKPKLELQFVGNVFPAFHHLFDKYSHLNVKLIPFMPYKEMLKYAQKASMLIKLNAVTEYSNGAIGAKSYDYLSLRRPILALGKEGCILEGILKETNSGTLCKYDDEKSVNQFIQTIYNKWKLGKSVLLEDNEELKKYKTQSNVKILIKMFEKVVSHD